MAYTSLEQRIASGYLAMFPAFVPQEDAAVPAAGQREFYGLMQRLYQLLVDEPELAVPALHQDDAYPTRYKKAYGKPELDSWVRKSKQAVDSLLKNMFLLGQGVPVRLNKRQQNILARVGIAGGGPLPDAWTWMASRPGANPTAFAYCLFDGAHVYSTGTWEEPFRKLERGMRSRGYRPWDCYKTDPPDFQLTLAYANPAWSPDRPNVGNEYKVKHTGISAQYDAYVQTPVSLGLCIPGGLKPFWRRSPAWSQPSRPLSWNTPSGAMGAATASRRIGPGRAPWPASPSPMGGRRMRSARTSRDIPTAGTAWTTP